MLIIQNAVVYQTIAIGRSFFPEWNEGYWSEKHEMYFHLYANKNYLKCLVIVRHVFSSILVVYATSLKRDVLYYMNKFQNMNQVFGFK